MKRKSISQIVVVMVVLAGFLALTSISSPDRARAAETIKIGSLMPQSGPLAVPGMAWNRGFEIYADVLKDQGGITINGKQYVFEVLDEDAQGSADAARSAALKLVHREGVKFVLGGLLEPVIQATNSVCEKAGVFYGATNANIPGHPADVSPDKPMQVRLNINYDDTHVVDLKYLKEHYPEAGKLAIVAPDIGYEPMIKRFREQTAERKFDIVHVEKFQWGTTDFVPVMTKVLKSKPDVIFAMVSGQAQYQLQAARQLGFNGPFVSNSPLAPGVFFNVVGRDICDKLIINSINTVETNEHIEEVINRWEEKYGERFVTDGVQGYDALWVLAQAIEEAQSLDPKKVMDAFESLTERGDLETCHGPACMGGKERFGVNHVLMRPIPVTHVVDGEIASTEMFPARCE
ncbi:MAG: ABC transporter substrate-binding protein [Desulfobacteraceae bacterium]|nr:ABC transporter substrate-binding protein [Desulfobacteraceae bacterium]